jgi:hypothetical protein
MAEILSDKCSRFSNVTIEVASFEEWICREDQKFDLIYSAQAFHWISKDIKYHKCSQLLKDNGYLALFWYNPSGYKLPETKSIDEKVNNVVRKYTAKYTTDNGKPGRLTHSGVFDDEERKKEIEDCGLFHIIRKLDYTHQVSNCADQYLKAMKSVPSFASILDGLDSNTIARMDYEIEEIINKHGGFVEEEFHYSLYLAQKKRVSL